MTPLKKLPEALLAFCIAAASTLHANEELSIQEQLGYAKDAKLLIIHADDLGVAHSKNLATFKAMEEGVVTSASIMANTPWVVEVANYSGAHPEADLGVHLTFTSEWDTYRWGPILGNDTVPSLVDENGHFHRSVPEFSENADLAEIEAEARAQIERIKELGVDFTHLDGHMQSMRATSEITELYIALGKEYGVPVRLHEHHTSRRGQPDLEELVESMPGKLSSIGGVPTELFPGGMAEHYDSVLKNLTPGLNILVLHLAYDDTEMQAITVNHPYWGAQWRFIDFQWAMADSTKKIIEEENIILVDWRLVKEKLFSNPEKNEKQ